MNVIQQDRKNAKSSRIFNGKITKVPKRNPGILSGHPYNVKSILSSVSFKTAKYSFNKNKCFVSKNNSFMGPPSNPPRKSLLSLNSTRPESSTSFQTRSKILANDTSTYSSSLITPKNKQNLLKYISSSSRGRSNPRSGRSTTTTTSVESCVILAISEGRGLAHGEVGMAAIDLRHPHIVLCQFSDSLQYTNTLTKINYFNPVEIVVPHTFAEGQQTTLYKLIERNYPNIPIQKVQRKHFNESVGLQQLQYLCAPGYSGVCLLFVHKFYALTAAAAVLKYVEYIQCVVFARESLKIEYHCSDNSMLIDVETAKSLELVQPLDPSVGPSKCLLGILGPTLTFGGSRLLRSTILQPPCNRELIESRLDCVQELIENDQGLFISVQDVIKKLTDIEKILFLCMETSKQELHRMCEAHLNQTLLLKTTLDLVPKLMEALETAESGRLRRIKMDLENPHYREISEQIRKVLHEDARMEKGVIGALQRCFAIKPEINGLLDVARRTYSELIDDIQKLVEQLAEKFDLQLRLNQNSTKGFHIVMPVAPKHRSTFDVNDLPDVFIQVQQNGSNITMTTEELIMLDQQARESLNEIQNMSNIVILGLLKDLRPFMSSLYKLCECVAELDVLLSLAQTSMIGSYIRPEFNTFMEVKNSMHPLLEHTCSEIPVANDIFACPEYNFTIITGPNMGGKSIYIKQIAVLQVMAQVGCFIPCTNAVFRITDHLFSRLRFSDSVELNASSYVLEMREIQYILKNVTPTSLIIIDELCRGTNSEEGTSIAWAICEELMEKDAFTFFTTHFLYLTRLQDLYCNVTNLCTKVTKEPVPGTNDHRLVYHYKMESGVTTINSYGLMLAEKTNIPKPTINLAVDLAQFIVSKRKSNTLVKKNIPDCYFLYNLQASIKQAMRKSQDSKEIDNIIANFKKDHHQIIENLNINASTTNSSILPRNETTNSVESNILSTSDSCASFDRNSNLPPKIIYSSDAKSLDQIETVNTTNFLKTVFEKHNDHFDPTFIDSFEEIEEQLTQILDDSMNINDCLVSFSNNETISLDGNHTFDTQLYQEALKEIMEDSDEEILILVTPPMGFRD